MVAERALRIVFFGTPEFAVPTLEALRRSSHPIVGVVTQPDRPRGRGQKTTAAAVKVCGLNMGAPILQPERLKDPGFLAELRSLDADLGVVAAYGKILTDEVLATPTLGLINVHASLLPKYRGAAPVHRAVVAGERETGVTIMRVVKALDAGPILATARHPVGEDETSEQVEHALSRMGAELLASTVDELAAGRSTEWPQDDAQATYAHRLSRDEGLVDWQASAVHIHNLIRGLYPWPHAFTFLAGRRFILLRSTATSDSSRADPGTILDATGDCLTIATGAGVIQIDQVQPEGRRRMGIREFLAGHRLVPGERFSAAP